jgi:hypothetical protein
MPLYHHPISEYARIEIAEREHATVPNPLGQPFHQHAFSARKRFQDEAMALLHVSLSATHGIVCPLCALTAFVNSG